MHFCAGVVISREENDDGLVDKAVDDALAPFYEFSDLEDLQSEPSPRSEEQVLGDATIPDDVGVAIAQLVDGFYRSGISFPKKRCVVWKVPKWDWYVIGGRSMGFFSGFKPADDPRYQEPCPVCRPPGKASLIYAIEPTLRRHGKAGCEERDCPCQRQFLSVCQLCEGKGTHLRLHARNQIRHAGDVWPIADLLSRRDDDWTPHAILTPDGEWGDGPCIPMPSYVPTPDVQTEAQWNSKVRDLLARCRDHYIVAVDCHWGTWLEAGTCR